MTTWSSGSAVVSATIEKPTNRFRATHYADGQYPSGASTVLTPLKIDWQYPLADIGTATVVLRASDPMVASIAPEDIIAIDIVAFDGSVVAAMAMIVDQDEDIAKAQNEEEAQVATYSGPLTLGVLKDGLIDPPGGVGRAPKVTDFVYDYTHPDYVEDGAWVGANDLMSVNDGMSVADGGGGLWPLPWASNVPQATRIIGPTAGSASDAPVGVWYWRDTFTTSFDGMHVVFLTADNAATLAIDGKPITTCGGEGDFTTAGFNHGTAVRVSLSAGTHTVAGSVTNYSPFGGPNPSGIAATVLIPNTSNPLAPIIVWNTSGSTHIDDYPAEVPGMTPGTVARLFLESQQALGRLTFVTLTCSDTLDSDGNAWAVTPTISVRVGQDDGLSLFLKMMAAYADVRVEPGTWVIDLFNKDAMAPASGVTFDDSNLTSLRFRRLRLTADELLVDSQLGWSRAAPGGRRQGYLPLGTEDNADELGRLATSELTVSSNPRDETTLTFRPADDSELPWKNANFVPGCTVTCPTRAGGTTTDRVVQIGGSFSSETGEVAAITVVIKDLILQDQERTLRAIKALGG